MLVRAPVVPLRHQRLVYVRKELLATSETATNVRFGDVMATSGYAGSHPGHGELRRGNLNEVQNDVISERCPSTDGM